MLLDRLIRNLSVTIEPFALCEVEGGCRLELEADDQVTVHFVLAGSGSLQIAGGSVNFAPQTLIVVPGGRRQELLAVGSDGTERTPTVIPDGLSRHRSLGPLGEPDVMMACGRISALFNGGPALFGHLREPVTIDFADSEEMSYLFGQVLFESSGREPGSTEMLAVLMNRCLVMAFRRLCTDQECPLPWLRALEDDGLGAALDAMLERPGANHSVESLAAAAGMSRTSFAEGFKVAFGAPPMTFLREVRLRAAADLLSEGRLGAGAVAKRVGFASRTHFVEAFRRYAGVTPGDYRKNGMSSGGSRTS